MKEYPILFNSEMIQALLAGKKTQTRRVLKKQPPEGYAPWSDYNDNGAPCKIFTKKGVEWVAGVQGWVSRSPYGCPGDQLWVRETFKRGHDSKDAAVLYRADGHIRPGLGDFEMEKWKPSIFMPREASRIQLEVTKVRLQHIQEISEEDAIAEGTTKFESVGDDQRIAGSTWDSSHKTQKTHPYTVAYASLWDEINANRGFGWATNPWCWAITFKRLWK